MRWAASSLLYGAQYNLKVKCGTNQKCPAAAYWRSGLRSCRRSRHRSARASNNRSVRFFVPIDIRGRSCILIAFRALGRCRVRLQRSERRGGCTQKGCRAKPVLGHLEKQVAFRIGRGLLGPPQTLVGVLAILCDGRHFVRLGRKNKLENPPLAHLWPMSNKRGRSHFAPPGGGSR